MSLEIHTTHSEMPGSPGEPSPPKNLPQDADVAFFQSLMSDRQDPLTSTTDWNKLPGYNPQFDRFRDRLEIKETAAGIKATLRMGDVPPHERDAFGEFVSWFKSKSDPLPEPDDQSPGIAAVVADHSSAGMPFNPIHPQQADGQGPINTILATRGAVRSPRMRGTEESFDPTPAKAAIQAGASPEALAAITQAALTTAPDQAPQVAAAITQAAIQAGASPETLAAITQAALATAPDQAPQVAAAITQAAIQAGASPKALAAITQRPSQETIQKGSEQAAAELATSAPTTGPQTNLQPASVQDPASPKAVPENVLKLIAETVSKISIGETQTTITLKSSVDLPGETTLTIQKSNGQLQVVIKATDAKAAQLLNANAAALQNVLKSAANATQVSVMVTHSDFTDSVDSERASIGDKEKEFRSPGSEKDEKSVKRGEKSKSSTQ